MRQRGMLYSVNFGKDYSISRNWLITSYLLVLLITNPLMSKAQDEPQYDEVSVFLNIQKVGGIEIGAVIKDESVFLPIADIFTVLKIKTTLSPQLDSVSGFFITPQTTYSIDKLHNRITFQGKRYDLKSGDLIKTETNLYLKSNWLGQVFGLDCSFNFRSLSVLLSTKLELPVIREMRQEQMRSNISKLKGEVKTDTTIERKYPAFHFGMADWSIISTQQEGGATDTRIDLALGVALAGGEANALLNYSNNAPFSEKQQQYQWRFVNNNHPILKQVTAGKIYSQITSSIFDPVVGVQFTNTPTTYRRSFGTYTLSDLTEPNWIVELYVNNVLVDYMNADASGFFKFEVPLVYGNSAVKLRFYGPWGEERIKEQNISIPFNFLPTKELEYSISAGMVEDKLSSRFSHASLNYGVNRNLTIGGGIEYLSSVETGASMPFLSASMRILNGLILTGEYTYGVRTKGLLNYRLPSNLQFELNYAKYIEGQKAIIYNYLEERKAVVSYPLKGKNFAAYTRLTVNQIVLPNLKNTTAEMLFSGSMYGVSTNFTTYGLFTNLNNPYLHSNLSFAFRLPAHITLTPQVQYSYNSGELISARASLEKSIFKLGFLNFSYEQNFRSNIQSIEFGFRFDLPFAQTGFSIRNSDNHTSLIESARGSLLIDGKTHYVGANNRTNVGKGAITLLPFLDINGDGKHDNGEPKVAGLQFKINGGTIIRNEKDTTIRILDLIPYTSYFLELDKNSFDNISWQMHNPSMKVNIDPNQFKMIEVPISVMGEATGTVYSGTKGLGRILVCFYRSDSTLVARALTESDGYFSYLGLNPGKYIVMIDPVQLKKLKATAVPEWLPIDIAPSLDGTIVESLDFKINLPEKGKTVEPTAIAEQEKPVTLVKTTETAVTAPEKTPAAQKIALEKKSPEPVITLPPVTTGKLKYYQMGAYKTKAVALAAVRILEALTVKQTTIVFENGYYKVRVLGLSGQEEANSLIYNIEHSQKQKVSKQKSAIINGGIKSLSEKRSNFIIQVGAFGQQKNATKVKEDLAKTSGYPVVIIFEDGYYKVQINGFHGWQQADKMVRKIIETGYSEAYIKRLK